MIVPLWNVQDEVGLPRLDDVVLLGGWSRPHSFLLVPRRYALALPAVVLAYFALAIQPIHAGAARDGAGGGRRALRRDQR